MAQPPRLIVGAVLVAALAAPVSAAVLLPGDLGDVSRSATAIVRGTVVGVRGEWTDSRRRVETIVTLKVSETYKGSLSGSVSVRVPGGVIGRYRSVTVGAPSFRQGEEVVLFLGARPPALPHLIGLGQGVFRVRRDPRTGAAVVAPGALLADSSRDVPVTRGDTARRPQSLQQFTASLRAALGAGVRDSRERDRPAEGGKGRGAETPVRKIK